MDAFVYLRVRPGTAEDVVVQLENVGSVRAATAVVGEWDVLAAVHGPDLQGIAEDVLRRVHGIDGVERTVTCPVVPGDVLSIAAEGHRAPIPMQERGHACFVHVQASPGTAGGLADTISGLEDVSAVAVIAGEYDLIVEVPYPWEQAAGIIVNHILPLKGVMATRTLVSIRLEPFEEDRDQFSAWS